MNFITTWPAFSASRMAAVLAAVLFFASACKRKDAELDLPSKDQDYQIGGIYTDTITVKTSTVYVKDSIVSSSGNQPYLMCGAYSDPVLGNVFASSYTQFRLTSENVDHTNHVATSAVLKLNYSYAYGDTTQAQTYEVYPLAEALSKESTYYTISNAPAFSSTKVGEVTFSAKPTSNPYLSIPIDLTYAGNVLSASTTTNSLFVNNAATYGFALVPKDQDKGAVILVAFSSETYFRIYYNNENNSPATPDSATYTINNGGAHFFKAEFDRSVSPLFDVRGLTASYNSVGSENTANQAFIHSMLGLNVKVEFPYLKNFLFQPDKGHVLVNRAVLEIPIASGSNSALRETTALVARKTIADTVWKVNGEPQLIQVSYADPMGSGLGQVVFSDRTVTPNVYNNLLTNHFLSIQTGKIANRPLLYSPRYSSSEVNRTVVDASNVKLKVYYTIVK